MNNIPVKDALIKELEGKRIDTGFGWRVVTNGQFYLTQGKQSKLQDYTVHQLRWWLKHAQSEPKQETINV